MEPLTGSECLEFLRAIERGEVTLQFDADAWARAAGWESYAARCRERPDPVVCPDDVWAGNCFYAASNGWKLVVFNDCGSWDYVDRVTAPDGRQADFDQIIHFIEGYTPSDEVARRCFGIGATEKWAGSYAEPSGRS